MTAHIDLAALIAATEGATPGPWDATREGVGIGRQIEIANPFVAVADVWGSDGDAAHIAAHDPDTCTALHAVVRAALDVVAGWGVPSLTVEEYIARDAAMADALAPFRAEP